MLDAPAKEATTVTEWNKRLSTAQSFASYNALHQNYLVKDKEDIMHGDQLRSKVLVKD